MATWSNQAKNSATFSNQTKNSASWTNQSRSNVADADYLLAEDGTYLLQEDGASKFILDQFTGTLITWTFASKN